MDCLQLLGEGRARALAQDVDRVDAGIVLCQAVLGRVGSVAGLDDEPGA